jgi:hypothetical protein
VAAGLWAHAAAKAAGDGGLARRSVAHFAEAIALRPKDEEPLASQNDYSAVYHEALLLDGQLNKALGSARAASDYYVGHYRSMLRQSFRSAAQLHADADIAASAAAALARITRDAAALRLTNRLSCESLLWLHHAELDLPAQRRKLRQAASQGQYPGSLPVLPDAKTTSGYRNLIAAHNDPSSIFRVSRDTNPDFCEAYEG